ncbi:hypothetical protein JCM17960_06950 [Magnetospira thiophila]
MAILFVLIVMIALPLVLILLVGMLPTWVAIFLVDRSKEKYSSFCVGGLNFCGTLPYLLDVWYGANTPVAAVKILTDVFAMLVMYGSAALGWILFMVVPPVVAVFLQVLNERKIQQLRAQQKQLVDEWGDEVTEGPKGKHDAEEEEEKSSAPPEAPA